MLKARALSIRQPWATLIVHGGKSIENRCWPTNLRGGFLIHAAKGMTAAEWSAAVEFAAAAGLSRDRLWDLCPPKGLPPENAMPRGGIIGYAELTDCISTERHEALPPAQQSRWFMGEYGFRLESVQPLPFLPVVGSLGFFWVEVPDDYLPVHLHGRLAP